MSKKVKYQDLGLIAYQSAWDFQTHLQKTLIEHKLAKAKNGLETEQIHHLLFCEHPHVYTLGRSGSMDNLLLSEAELVEKEATFFKINRGGDITYHGPGQIVGYPILDLDCFYTDVHLYVTNLEEMVIRTLAEYGIEAGREKGYTGVWLPKTATKPKRKICAIGVHLSRWVTLHGFAFNVNANLDYFSYIIPCGIADEDKSVTSMNKELGVESVDINEVKSKMKKHFADLFQAELVD